MAHWRGELAAAPAGRKVGLLWKSMRADFARSRFYSPFELWAPVLTAPGTTMVNIQYGDCAAGRILQTQLATSFAKFSPPGHADTARKKQRLRISGAERLQQLVRIEKRRPSTAIKTVPRIPGLNLAAGRPVFKGL